MKVTSLFVYPIKACKAVPLREGRFDLCGFRYDRRWVVYQVGSEDGTASFLTQRQIPDLARVCVSLTKSELRLTAPDLPATGAVAVPLPPPVDSDTDPASVSERGKALRVRVWSSVIDAYDEGDDVASWLSQALGRPVRLARKAFSSLHQESGASNARIGFQDNSQLLVISEASLADLNSRLVEQGEEPVPMSRFRPNVVVAHAPQPYAEDSWLRVQIGESIFAASDGCMRCRVTTTDQDTAEVGTEPLRILGTFRTNPETKRPFFGWYYVSEHKPRDAAQPIQVGDTVTVLKHRYKPPANYPYPYPWVGSDVRRPRYALAVLFVAAVTTMLVVRARR